MISSRWHSRRWFHDVGYVGHVFNLFLPFFNGRYFDKVNATKVNGMCEHERRA
jgi:hypothetical protein